MEPQSDKCSFSCVSSSKQCQICLLFSNLKFISAHVRTCHIFMNFLAPLRADLLSFKWTNLQPKTFSVGASKLHEKIGQESRNFPFPAGRNCYAVILLAFQIFVGYLASKLSDICCIMCVECAFQKSYHLVVQNLNFGKSFKSGN